MQRIIALIFTLLFPFLSPAQERLTIEFKTAVSELSSVAAEKIDSFLYYSKLPLSAPVRIYGYADSVGDTAYNRQLSLARAEKTKQYLLRSGLPEQQIVLVAGMGEGSARTVLVERGGKPPAKEQPVAPPKKVDLTEVKKGESVALENIFFEGGTAIILPESIPTLEALYAALTEQPKLRIRLEGHTCCASFIQVNSKYDMNLSFQRAHAVLNYLKSKGITEDRLSVIGFGGTRPRIVPEQTALDQQKNRRVEVRVMER